MEWEAQRVVGDGVCTEHRVGKGQFSLVEDFSLASAGMGVHLKHGSFHVTRRARRAWRESVVGGTVRIPFRQAFWVSG